MKNLKLIFSAIVLLSTIFVGCKKDKYQDYSTLVHKNAQVGDLPTLISTLDKDTVIQIPFTLTEKPIVDMYITVAAISGTATEGEDYEINTPTVFIPAFQQNGLIEVHILADDVLEGPESFVVQVGDSLDANVHVIKNITFNLDDFVASEFDLTFDWNRIVTLIGIGNYPTGPNMDFDFYLLDDAFMDTGNYGAATGASPEHLTLDLATYTGTYYVFSNLFENGFTENGIYQDDTVPVKTTIHRQGSLAGFTYVQPNDEAYTLSSTDYLNDGDDSFNPILKLVITATGFTAYDASDNSLVSGRRKKVTMNDIKLNKKSTFNSSHLLVK